MGKVSRDKGRRGETGAKAIINPVFYPNPDEGRIVKTPRSGGWRGETILSGDLVCVRKLKDEEQIDRRFPFFFEVKNVRRSTVPAFGILGGHVRLLADGWWAKAKEKSPPNYYTLVLWKVDFSEWFVFLSLWDFRQLEEGFGPLPADYAITEIRERSVEEDGPEVGWVNMPWATFARWFKRSVFTGGE